MYARIFKPAQTAMQAGKANTKEWVLEFDAEAARRIDPLMGWTSAEDMTAGQVRLSFESEEKAVAYAQKHNIPYRVAPARERTVKPKAYSDNFAYRRRAPWTH